jgi:site-specific recombinase XerD
MTKKTKKEIHQYVSSELNYKVCLDCTQLGKCGELLLAVDLSTRAIIGHNYKIEKHQGIDVVQLLKLIKSDRDFIPSKINILHVDNGNEFDNSQVKEYCEIEKIELSYTEPGTFQNQVIERLNRTIKKILRNRLDPTYIKGSKDPLKEYVDYQTMAQVVHNAIEEYNNTTSKITNVSPNIMESALYESERQESLPLLAVNDFDLNGKAQEIKKFKQISLDKYYGNAWEFFYDFRQENKELARKTIEVVQESAQLVIAEAAKKSQRLLNEIKENARIVEENALILQKKYDGLLDKHLRIEQALSALQAKNDRDQAIQDEKLATRLKKRNAIKLPIRDTISPEHFELTISLLKGNKILVARRKVAYFLLYLTGLRASNLLVFTVKHIKELCIEGTTTIPLIKGGEQRKVIIFPRKFKEFFKKARLEVDILIAGKDEGDFLFTSADDFKKPMNKNNFIDDLNQVLQEVSKITGENIRSHSFRATVITTLLEEQVPIQEVMSIIGHKTLESTQSYNRSKLTEDQVKERLSRRNIKTRKNKLIEKIVNKSKRIKGE